MAAHVSLRGRVATGRDYVYAAAAVALLSFGAPAQIAYADGEPPAETIRAALKAGVDPIDLQGAINTTSLDADSYLCATGELQEGCPVSRPEQGRILDLPTGTMRQVRLTYYALDGVTYGCTIGTSLCGTRPGGTACSWNFALGTRFRFPDGEVFVCNDRGSGLGSNGWLDVWRRADLPARYGSYVTVEILK